MLLPFLWMLATSFKPVGEIFTRSFALLPHAAVAWGNYVAAVTHVPMLRFMANGAVVCAGILALQLLVAIPCAYALAKLDFRGRDLLFGLVIFGLTIPIQVPALPIYLVFARLSLLDSYTSLIAPFTISVFAVFLLRQFFKTFPDEILDAARLDGHSEWSIAWTVMLPSAWPVISAFSIFSAVSHWNDLYWPLVVITSM